MQPDFREDAASAPDRSAAHAVANVVIFPDRRRATRERVLVVNGDLRQARAVARMLDMLGYHAAVASDLAAALTASVDDRPDHVLWDIDAPGIDRREAARLLRDLLTRNS